MNILDLQAKMMTMDQVDCPVTNHFTDGCYARELFIPAGVCLVGAEHKTNHFLMVMQGECFISNNGEKAIKVCGPQLLETKAGTQRAITAISDTILVTFHVTDKTDIDEIGEDILQKDNIASLPQWKAKAIGKDK